MTDQRELTSDRERSLPLIRTYTRGLRSCIGCPSHNDYDDGDGDFGNECRAVKVNSRRLRQIPDPRVFPEWCPLPVTGNAELDGLDTGSSCGAEDRT